MPTGQYDQDRIDGMQEALSRLRQKSRSFYLASGVFHGRLRIDLILLYVARYFFLQIRTDQLSRYSFCRVADDLIDNAKSTSEARHWITQMTRFLGMRYASGQLQEFTSLDEFVTCTFPSSARAALLLLPTPYLSPKPLYDLLKGFEMDLDFSDDRFPIKDDLTLELYGSRVAGTVAESCIDLVYHHTCTSVVEDLRRKVIRAGGLMGIALQYVNIARDIQVDAQIGRVYLPTTWLLSEGLKPEEVVIDPENGKIEVLRQRLLNRATDIYEEVREAIELLPSEARGPMRVAVESYMEIGRVLQTPGYKLKAGRATVPKLRRLRVAWSALAR